MGALSASGVLVVQHYAPLQYLPFIARSRALLSKPSLAAAGFKSTHLRSTSWRRDVDRGFNSYVHMTLDRQPRILASKLDAGFPHFALSVPAASVEATPYSLCRFNVAKTRSLRRGKKPAPESNTNGRYYHGHDIPIASTEEDKVTMLAKHLPLETTIEVLIPVKLTLRSDTKIFCYSEEDERIGRSVLEKLQCPWQIELIDPPSFYPRGTAHGKAVEDFIAQALSDPDWRGNGLEFDRL